MAAFNKGWKAWLGILAYLALATQACRADETAIRLPSGVEVVSQRYPASGKMLAVWLTGQYGYKDMYMGVPCVIGGKGVEKIVELPLNDEEKAMLAKSAASVQSVVDVVKKMAG